MLLSQRRVRRERLEQVLAERRSTLDPELRVETAVLAGRPSDALIEFAAETDVDLIVTGSRHWGPLFAAVAGSTSRRLADRAPCPVLIAPRGHGRPLVAPGTADLAGRV
jgi:nucleotide-binding universal stress UspA family protein